MTVVALTHGYPPLWNMGGEVALHRTLLAIEDRKIVLTSTANPYELDSIRVVPIDTPDVLDINADPEPLASQLAELGATLVIGQNELSLPAVKAARLLGIASLVSIHTPPRYGSSTKAAVPLADHVLYNTRFSATEWGEPNAPVVHPPISPLPSHPGKPAGDAYTILSSLTHKGVEIVLELAARYPTQRFIVVESPATQMEPVNLRARIAELPNVELYPRVAPEDVAGAYLSQTRILLVPSRYETYGMSAIEAAGYGIPAVHVDTPHAREGIGEAAVLVPPLNTNAVDDGIRLIEADYAARSWASRARAERLAVRQAEELEEWGRYVSNIAPLSHEAREARPRKLFRMAPRVYRRDYPRRGQWTSPKQP